MNKIIMRSILPVLLLILSSISYGQEIECEVKLEILKKLFDSYEIKDYEGKDVFETKVWEKHATVSFENCYVIAFPEGITAMAFNIYLSEDPDQYRYMIEEGIQNLMELNESNMFKGGDQRLIQVIFYDTKNETFLAKGEGFPLSGFSWVPEGMGDITTLNTINSFKLVEASDNTCILTIMECPSCVGGLHYVFKFHEGKVLTSPGIDACYESIVKRGNALIMNIITNCYEHEYDGESPQTEEELLFKW